MATINLGRIKPVFRGAYSGVTAYVVDDIVTSSDETFICILASTGNATSNATYWTKLAAKGTDGTDVGTTITTQGDILYRDGSGLQRLAKPASSKLLQMTSGGVPSWTTVDLTPVRQDILTLALKQAVEENHTKYNLPNSSIVKFEADADFNLAGSTAILRNASEYIYSATMVSGGARVSNTLEGNATRSSTDKKFGTYSLYCAADGDYWKSGSLQGVTGMPETGDFTVDYWFKQENWGYADRDFAFGPRDGTSQPTLSVGFNATSQMNVYMDEVNNNMSSISHDTSWHHWAFQRSGTTLYHWVDGVYKSNFSNASSQVNLTQDTTSQYLMISGRHGTSTEYSHGYYDEFRLSNVARYTNSTNFTVPSVAYTIANGGIDDNTMLIMHFEDTDCNDSSAEIPTVSATGTALGTTNVPTSAVTDVSGVMLLKNKEGTATFGSGNDIIVSYTCDNSNWTAVTDYTDAGTFSTGIKMIKLGKKTCTSGSDVRWKIEFANQSDGSKETLIYGIGLNY